ncbi:MAG: amino-acid N-acetyltransferase [Betaproteobacteria bacterium]|nr:amino-acid N-acetyltransferase [Betaproteobacteria bacterium]
MPDFKVFLPARMPFSAPADFVRWFRSAAPYIHAFRGRTFVIAFGGEVVADGKFMALTYDLNLLASLGVRLVLVHGARPQIETRLKQMKHRTRYVRGLRVTDDIALICAKEASGRLRVEIEALLSMGLPNSPMAGSGIRVASGNFVTAKPIGVLDGVDFVHTGEVRKIDAIGIRDRLDHNEMVLLSPLGYSPTGESFNLTLENVAASAAVALGAEKLIFLMDSAGVVTGRRAELQHELTCSEAERLLARDGALPGDVGLYLPHAVSACRAGVKRAHLISRRADGALLLELFTHRGVGTMVTQDTLEKLRPARIDDIGGIMRLIEPLEADGTLVKRNRDLLEMEIDRFFVLEHDRVIIGCAALYPFEGGAAELAGLAVDPEHRGAGAGERLLRAIEARAKQRKIRRLFVLTTRTAHWFIERGFKAAPVSALPRRRQDLYNYQRRSQVFVKRL